ncbi:MULTISPECIES: ABC transporter permease [unclassified Rhizobium]|uniref:ABC transporter permease n=1 Tax=unclassified Rhizobium TaxID=2613769 RepID=UPI00104FD0B7|nr:MULTISPECIES: ABC transporter permease [unclassified Rhizobium]TCS03287.1 ABC-2 type transport system permease protein [Rhizobium sp. BK418]
MWGKLNRIFRLGIKELYSLKADPVMMVLIVYTFTIAVYTVSTGAKLEVENASVAVIDEDRSMLSMRLRDAMLKPFFKEPVLIGADEVDAAMNAGHFVFVLEIPPKFEEDAIGGRRPSLQLDIDATAMSQAGNGASYIQNIILREVETALPNRVAAASINLVVSARFNPNLQSTWFTAVMQVINNVTMLSVILTGAALIREREHGTIEHLLVMPVTPAEIMMSKVWANGLVIVLAAVLSLTVVVERLLSVPIAGSIGLFVFCALLYQFSVTWLGILIATASSSMAQFGLISMPILITMNLLSGSTTPMDSMPLWLQYVMIISPTPHFVSLSQAILYRGAGWDSVWQQAVVLGMIGMLFFTIALVRFRQTLADVR